MSIQNLFDLKAEKGKISAISSRAGAAFIDLYYKNRDKDFRTIEKFYQPNSLIVYDGTPMSPKEFIAFLDQYPKTQHNIDCFDCGPIVSSKRSNERYDLSLIVYGDVRLDKKSTRSFVDTFYLRHDSSSSSIYYIYKNCFRMLPKL